MIFRKIGSRDIIYMPCKLNLVESQVLYFLLYVASKNIEKRAYSVPIIVLKKYLNTTSVYKVTKALEVVAKISTVLSSNEATKNYTIFSSFCIKPVAIAYSLHEQVKEFLRSSYALPNPFIIRSLSCRYSIFVCLVAFYFKSNKRSPEITCAKIIEQLDLTETSFVRLKFFFYRVIGKALLEINRKTRFTISKSCNKLKKSVQFSIEQKVDSFFFTAYYARSPNLMALIKSVYGRKKTFQFNDGGARVDSEIFVKTLQALNFPEKSISSIVNEFSFMTVDDLDLLMGLHKTSSDNMIYISQWLKSLESDSQA